MEGESIVSKAKIAFHSAAAKAERVLTDFKSDLRGAEERLSKVEVDQFNRLSPSSKVEDQKGSNEAKRFRWKPPNLGTRQEWQDRLKNIGKGRKGTEDSSPKMAFPIYDQNIYLYNEKVDCENKGLDTTAFIDGADAINKDVVLPSSVLKQLIIAAESEKNHRTVKDLLISSTSSSPVRERASLGISAVKSLMLGEKEGNISSELGDNEVWSFIQSVLDAEGLSPCRNVGFLIETSPGTITLPREIHGAPPESLIVKVSEVIGSFKTLRMMALFWCRLVAELRRIWLEEQYIPGIPLDEVPDLNSCLLYQQMQLMNCSVSRKRRRVVASDSLESLIREADGVPSSIERITSGSFPFVKTPSGELVLRLGASHQAENLTMLETGEPIYAPVTQEVPLFTEDLAREAEEFVLRTGSVGAGCSQLLSDMQAFKAANPGCVLEDFVRWHSPPDWLETESSNDYDACSVEGDSTPSRGRLSGRMQKAGNLWRELWDTSKPVPAVRQAPLFDEDLAVEGVLNLFEEISPAQLFGQLFRSLLGLGFVIAGAKLPTDKNTSKVFYECKDYVVAACQGEAWLSRIDDLLQVYETVEAIYIRPEDVRKMVKQPEDANTTEEPKHRFKKLTQMFGRKNRLKIPSSDSEDDLTPKNTQDNSTPKNTEDNSTRQQFSNFFDNKSSLFSKKPPRPENPAPQDSPTPDDNEWTLV